MEKVTAPMMATSYYTNDVPKRFQNSVMDEEDQKLVTRFWVDWISMNNNRALHEWEWKRKERQFRARIGSEAQQDIKSQMKAQMIEQFNSTNSDIKLQVDRNILEQFMGENGFKFPYKIIPEGKEADSTALETSKYVLDYFADKENVLDEIIDFRWDTGVYGTGFLYSGIWITQNIHNEPIEWDGFGTKWEQEKTTQYHIGIKNWNIWDVWCDERAKKWRDVRRVIMREKMDIDEFLSSFLNRPWFKYIESVQPIYRDTFSTEEVNKDNASVSWPARNVYLFHSYNETTGEYIIYANRQYVIYKGFNIYKNAKIPLESCQMYKSNFSIYGNGVGDKTQSFLAYMNTVFGLLLDKTYNASNPPLVVGNNGTLEWEIFTWGGDIPILNFNGDVKNIQQLQFDSSIDWHVAVIDKQMDQIIQNTGINTGEYNKPLSGINPFVAGIQEQAKKAKLALTSAMFDIAIAKALTKMLNNLTRFGAELYATKLERIVDGTALEDVRYMDIQIKGKEAKKKWKKGFRFKEAPWIFSYIPFTPDLLKSKEGKAIDMAVRIVTPWNETSLEALKKTEFNEFVKNLQLFPAMYPGEPLPVEMKELYEMMCETYGYDMDALSMMTESDKMREESVSLIEGIRGINPENIANDLAQAGQGLAEEISGWSPTPQVLWMPQVEQSKKNMN